MYFKVKLPVLCVLLSMSYLCIGNIKADAAINIETISKRLKIARDRIKTIAITEVEQWHPIDKDKEYVELSKQVDTVQTWQDSKKLKVDITTNMPDGSNIAPQEFTLRTQYLFNNKAWIQASKQAENDRVTTGIVTSGRPLSRFTLVESMFNATQDIPIRTILSYGGFKVSGEEQIEGVQCIVVDGLSTESQMKLKLWFSPKHDLIMKKELYDSNAELIGRDLFTDLKEIEQGIWLPTTIRFENPNENVYISRKVLKHVVNQEIADDMFEIDWGDEGRIYDKIANMRYRVGVQQYMQEGSSQIDFDETKNAEIIPEKNDEPENKNRSQNIDSNFSKNFHDKRIDEISKKISREIPHKKRDVNVKHLLLIIGAILVILFVTYKKILFKSDKATK